MKPMNAIDVPTSVSRRLTVRNKSILLSICLCLCGATPAVAEVSVAVRTPNVSIGVNVPVYPDLVRVPNYPVYYAPQMNSNYFFYDSVYWVYQDDRWYASSWYNGPWEYVDPFYVPAYVLRVPVRYYRRPPPYFHGWHADAPPHWDEHWGSQWSQRRDGWDRWQHSSHPAPAPLPSYQRHYAGDRYPNPEVQHELRNQHYTYQPHDEYVRSRVQSPKQDNHSQTQSQNNETEGKEHGKGHKEK
jgi:hypothetical protein